MNKIHSFFIPVMGTGFTLDTPIKLAQYGISSVLSLVDDTLIEQMRQHYCGLYGEEYQAITKDDDDYRARRITAYLNLVDLIVQKKFALVKAAPFIEDSEITKYFELLDDQSTLKGLYREMLIEKDQDLKARLQSRLREQMAPGEINVNIMTKLDRTNYSKDKKPLPEEFSDALAALRGFAKSRLQSAVVFSAGFNRRLYSYVEKFEDFFANARGEIKKKIIVKVSDYRSALIQGQFFAKKGLWVSEYRVESGLNCGGHAFPSKGHLLGPILNEFKTKRQELIDGMHVIYNKALEGKKRKTFDRPHTTAIAAQGGIGTATEDRFLRTYHDVDQTGWGTPFLLVPEAVNIDEDTLKKLCEAGEDGLSVSGVSPLNVPFNNLNNSLSELEKQKRIDQGAPGSPCFKGHLAFNTEFTETPICIASRRYQQLKIDELNALGLNPDDYERHYQDIIKKACICHDLGGSALLSHHLVEKSKAFPAICPGPNLAYFSKIATLKEMVGHIYGRINLLATTHRPHMYIKELRMYVEYFFNELKAITQIPDEKQIQYLNEFKQNLLSGIDYYRQLFPKMLEETEELRQKALEELSQSKAMLEKTVESHQRIFSPGKMKTISA